MSSGADMSRLGPSEQDNVPDSSICERCAAIDFDTLTPGKAIKESLNSNVISPVVADQSCQLCKIFSCLSKWDVGNNHRATEQPNSYSLYPFYTSQTHASKNVVSRLIGRVTDSISFTLISENDVTTGFEAEDDSWDRIRLRMKNWMTPVFDDEGVDRFSGKILTPKVDFGLVQGWLTYCTNSHRKDSCGAFPGRKGQSAKVINCSTRELVPMFPGCRYTALSYVWGDIKASFSSVEMQNDTLPARLPNTIEDAIIATLELGFDYVWIDRYCIDQDDQKERHAQIAQMDIIYSNAQVTLVAAAGSDPTAGLPGVSTKLRSTQQQIILHGKKYITIPPDPHVQQPALVWYRRGWTYQEVILSRRRVHFLDDQLYFTCGSMYCRDVLASPLEAWNFKNKGRLRTTPWYQHYLERAGFSIAPGKILTPNTKIPNPLHETFIHIGEYSVRSLSNPDDVLNGILGVFQRLRALYPPFRHFYGIPVVVDKTLAKKNFIHKPKENTHLTFTEQFTTSLSWYHSGPRKRRNGFPSWSWAGWHGKVLAPGRFGGYIRNTNGLTIQVEGRDNSIKMWESFCATDEIRYGLDNYSPVLRVGAFFYRLKLWFSETQRISDSIFSSLEGYWAQLQTNDGYSAPAPFHFTPAEFDDAGTQNHSVLDECDAFIIGTRHDTYFAQSSWSSAETKGVSSEISAPQSQPVVVLLAVQTRNGMSERIGIVEFRVDLIINSNLTVERREILLG